MSARHGAASPSPGDGPGVASPIQRAVPAKPDRFTGVATAPALARLRAGKRAAGALAGKTVYLSAGHGWNQYGTTWRTQRGNTHDLVEDFITAEGVNEYLIRYLHAMGAYVVPLRESDRNPNLVIVDDGEAIVEGEVTERPSADVGWGAFETPFEDLDLQPFARGGARQLEAAPTETGRAVLAANVAVSGYYNVYFAYVQGPDRAPDAHVIVRHAGGEAAFRIDQRRHGSTWMLLGRWYFDAGAPPERASVAIANDSSQPGAVISFDAIRLGGGMGVHAVAGATTGRPAFESSARYATQLLGAPRDVYAHYGSDDSDDVVARPRFAAWEHEDGEDAIYLSWHTNAPDPGRGTTSIAYGNTYPCCRGLDDFAGTAGSLELLDAVHRELVGDLRADFDPAWPDRGEVTAALGELSPGHNPEMPAILVELAFHSTAVDADALRQPRFRRLAARAMAQGIARFFAARDGEPLVLPPEPPTAVRVENAGGGRLRVSWRAPAGDAAGGDAPTGYRVYVGDHGYAFDDGTEVTGEELVLDELPAGALRFVRVAAVNAGGESLPTEVVGARVAADGAAPILVVGAYDRLDGDQLVRDEAPLVGAIDRMWIDRINNGTVAVRHARALAAAGYAFDGATDEALGDVTLAGYEVLDWAAGEQIGVPAAARDALAAYAAGGGQLLVSGSELVWGLDPQGTADDQAFAHDVLRVSLAADDAETYDAAPLDGVFAGLPALSFRDLGDDGYDVRFPDVLTPGPGATAVLAYPDGGAAAVASPGVIVLGFPLDVVAGDDARLALLDAAMTSFGVAKEPPPSDDGGDDPAGGDILGGCCGTSGDPAGALVLGALVALGLGRPRRRA